MACGTILLFRTKRIARVLHLKAALKKKSMNNKSYTYIWLVSIALTFGCHSHKNSMTNMKYQIAHPCSARFATIQVPLWDPIFIASSGRDSSGIISLQISNGDPFGNRAKTVLPFCFVDPDLEKNIPPQIYVGGRLPTDKGTRRLSPRETASVVYLLQQYLESHYDKDQLSSLWKNPELPVESTKRSKPPYCLIHILHQHKHYLSIGDK